ncbi:polysaccharide biosynthesis tyrosine autokinase [Hymenobacter sp. BT559]|uniref:polysaccharide biosynthesis tyrosine autokinase n=1 Tax=Hymenobacter sp. BT559 TaxID=2795729 RepID=UPI0018EB9FCC|nr:polysaccharide biosynthesis tyrosine autokinase [Hymenobacter sp. BT559]MBJ6143780.1 polysaccharide biosynthesis tyrosine autokinase [Hymenobacter sp. BT559]
MDTRPAPFSAELDLNELFFNLRRRWPVFVVSLLVAGALAWTYLKVKSPTYDFKATLLIGDQSTGSKQAQELLQLLDSKPKGLKLEDEVGLLTSSDMLRRTLNQLPFTVSYFVEPDSWLNAVKPLQVRERAPGDVPFWVIPAPNRPQLTGVPIYVEALADNKFRVHADAKRGELRQLATGDLVREVQDVKFDQVVAAGDTLRSALLTVVFRPEPDQLGGQGGHYFFKLNDINSLVGDYQTRLKVKPTDHESRILELTTQGTVPAKETQFLNTLMNTYVQDDLKQKNQVGGKTVAFLDNEISKLAESKSRAGQNLSSFRASNNVVDVNAQSGASIQQQSALTADRARLVTNRRVYQNMLDYLKAHRAPSDAVTLSSNGVEDPATTGLIQQLSEQNNQRAALAVSASDINPIVKVADEKIATTKELLIQNLTSLVAATDNALRDADQRLGAVRSELNRMPENERQLGTLTNTSTFNEKNYSYLVEKRNEAAIALATNSTDKKIVDAAKQSGLGPSSPKPLLVGLLALLAGLVLPAGLVLMQEKTNSRVQSKEDLARLTNIPMLGVIPHGTTEDKQTMLHDPRSPIAEAFRAVRVNMQYLAAGLDKRVIGVTSSVPGEGKSFCTVNLAAELAQSGRRVIVLECDMRRPTLASYFDIDPRRDHGLSTYLAGESALDQARHTTSIASLDVICCGPLPHNPTRLIEGPRLAELIQMLREEYDYILVDIPPLGYVSEFLVLLQHLDAKIYVVRQNYTDRALVGQIAEMHREHNVKQLYMVMNDVHFAQSYEYRYKANAYKYGV